MMNLTNNLLNQKKYFNDSNDETESDNEKYIDKSNE